MHSLIICGGNIDLRSAKIQTFLPPDYTINHPDVKIIDVEEGKKNIGIGQVREITHFLLRKPLKHNKNVVIIKSAEGLTTEAQNALLKTLEEPPENSIIILETLNENNLLPTIKSRCSIIKLAQSTNLQETSIDHNKTVKDFVDLLNMDQANRFNYIQTNKSLYSKTGDFLYTLDIWESVLRDIMLLNESPSPASYGAGDGRGEHIINKQNINLMGTLHIPNQKVIELLEFISELKINLRTTNINTQIAMETLILNI